MRRSLLMFVLAVSGCVPSVMMQKWSPGDRTGVVTIYLIALAPGRYLPPADWQRVEAGRAITEKCNGGEYELGDEGMMYTNASSSFGSATAGVGQDQNSASGYAFSSGVTAQQQVYYWTFRCK